MTTISLRQAIQKELVKECTGMQVEFELEPGVTEFVALAIYSDILCIITDEEGNVLEFDLDQMHYRIFERVVFRVEINFLEDILDL